MLHGRSCNLVADHRLQLLPCHLQDSFLSRPLFSGFAFGDLFGCEL